ncbi:hypothetical protein AWB83_02420 [Caballeronia ptereochthonis]|uniref:Uncharacterized protein n=1 Tax=Caballeronia ptereochthonis TaxID=1777144 RepID=A0A158AW02_9BURK|nr:transposase [Caballeronia ptereochthonis]SAK61923.1 hypothetical protein AWB83_02420 [Caballeronia ptereochthonis]
MRVRHSHVPGRSRTRSRIWWPGSRPACNEETQALVDQQAAAAAVQRQQAQSEIARLGADLATVREQLSGATAALSAEQEAHAGTRVALHQRDLDVERLTQQVRDQTERLAEQESFQSWIDDRPRCKVAGVPDTIGFATKPQLARQMLERALDAGVPAAGSPAMGCIAVTVLCGCGSSRARSHSCWR